MMKRLLMVLFHLHRLREVFSNCDLFALQKPQNKAPTVYEYDRLYDGKKSTSMESTNQKHPSSTHADLFSPQKAKTTKESFEDVNIYKYETDNKGKGKKSVSEDGPKYYFFFSKGSPHYSKGDGKGKGEVPSKGKGKGKGIETPTILPSSEKRSRPPSDIPTTRPSQTSRPTHHQTTSFRPSIHRTFQPSKRQKTSPTFSPTLGFPNTPPSKLPTGAPNNTSSSFPTSVQTPTNQPTSTQPTDESVPSAPTNFPSSVPSILIPTKSPFPSALKFPTVSPSSLQSVQPTLSRLPSVSPTSASPTDEIAPSASTNFPSSIPSIFIPTKSPFPSAPQFPTVSPSPLQSVRPTLSHLPSVSPTFASPTTSSQIVEATPFGVLYSLVAGSGPTPEQFAEASDLTLTYIDQFLATSFASIPETRYIGQVSVPTSRSINPVTIDYAFTAIFADDSQTIPTASQLDQLIRQSLSEPAVNTLISDLRALAISNPFSTTTQVSYFQQTGDAQLTESNLTLPLSIISVNMPPSSGLSVENPAPAAFNTPTWAPYTQQNISGNKNIDNELSTLKGLVCVSIAGILIGTIGLIVLYVQRQRSNQMPSSGISQAQSLAFAAEESDDESFTLVFSRDDSESRTRTSSQFSFRDSSKRTRMESRSRTSSHYSSSTDNYSGRSRMKGWSDGSTSSSEERSTIDGSIDYG